MRPLGQDITIIRVTVLQSKREGGGSPITCSTGTPYSNWRIRGNSTGAWGVLIRTLQVLVILTVTLNPRLSGSVGRDVRGVPRGRKGDLLGGPASENVCQ